MRDRIKRLMPGGVPKYIRVYDNGGTRAQYFCKQDLTFHESKPEGKKSLVVQRPGSADRYTVVYTGRYAGKHPGTTDYRAMSEAPDHPLGIGQWGEFNTGTDCNEAGFPPAVGASNHLGRRITFEQLPERCKRVVLDDYRALWNLNPTTT